MCRTVRRVTAHRDLRRINRQIAFAFALLISVCSHSLLQPASCFNFDTENPIVIHNSFNHPASHFGAEVTLIPQQKNSTVSGGTSSSTATTGWIIIGAPKANSTHANYTSINEPGLLWRCSLGPAINCQPVLLDPLGELDIKRGQVPHINLVHHDRKEGSMLGASAASRGSNFVACASRWMNQKYVGYHLMNGLCCWIDTKELIKEEPTAGRPGNATVDWCELDSTRLLPLVDRGRLAYTVPNTDPVEKRFDWAFGQAGFSTHFTENNELLLGAPGVLEWTGAIIRYRNVSGGVSAPLGGPAGPAPSLRGGSRPGGMGRRPGGPQLQRNPAFKPPFQPFNQVVVIKAQSTRKVLQYFDYFGYAVTSGRFFRKTSGSSAGLGQDNEPEMQYASGAPRAAALSGQVLVFTINEGQETINLLVDPLDGGYNGFGSYFGSVLAAGDMNGDGFDELLIGAPLYSSAGSSAVSSIPTLKSEASRNGSGSGPSGGEAGSKNSSGAAEDSDEGPIGGSTGDEGCVFVYFSNGDHFIEKTQELCGGHYPGARFGSAISIIGDINDDSILDVAIGAPYENEGHGVVYIYHGSRTILVLVQKLNPLSIQGGIRGFGLSLSNGVDIDGNQFPDLAVGAYDSNHVIIYRNIPVVNITGNLSTSVTKLHSSTRVFDIQSCLTFNGRNAPESMRIWVKLTVDIEVRKHRIVEFVTTDPNTSTESGESKPQGSSSSKKLQLTKLNMYQRDGDGSCYTYQATTVGDLGFITVPVTIRQEFWPESNPRINPHDTVNNAEAIRKTKPIHIDIKSKAGIAETVTRPSSPKFTDFSQKLPQSMFGDNVGSTFYSIPIAAICEEDGDPDCLAELTFSSVLENPDGDEYSDEEPFIIGSYRKLLLKVELLNLRETANLPLTMDISWIGPPYFKNNHGITECRKKAGPGAGSVTGAGNAGGDGSNLIVGRGAKLEQSITCSFKKPLTRNKKETVEIELDTDDIYSDGVPSLMTFQVSANTSSALVNPAEASFQFPIIGKTDLLFYGHGSEAPYYDNMTAETVNFTHIYEIGIQGPSPIHSVLMDFWIPVNVEIEDIEHELLRIREPTTTYDGNRLRCTSVNSPFYIETTTTSSEYDMDGDEVYLRTSTTAAQTRAKRSVSSKKSRISESLKSQLVLGCASSVLSLISDHPPSHKQDVAINKCLHVQCEAHFFHPGSRAVIEFRLRLLTHTTKELFTDEDRETVVIQSIGRVSMMSSTGDKFGESLISSPKAFVKVQRPTELEAWILIVAMGSGLILLTLLTVFLTRCGFFRRIKREELDALKAQQEVNEHFGLEFTNAFGDPADEYEYGAQLAAYHQPHEVDDDGNFIGGPVGAGHSGNLDLDEGVEGEDVDYGDYAEIYEYRIYDDGRTHC